ncbi:MAG: aspartate carbamoyltransferase catalytic subunit [Coriobacteriales bacterium]|jgi:aspartate carbamoyltransferase catalytic subunit|nr:aspartate carbamoyltransferase catalytic subunit [Coriobacteriales bacterium]
MGALSCRHVLSMSDLSVDDIDLVLETATPFKEVNERAIKKTPTLRGLTVVNFFLEASTRTRTSFEIAAKRLSADAINFGGSASATAKGESLVDTAQTLDAMNCDLVVIRHRYAGSPFILTQNMRAHVINGGDGKHQHPTQALLDLYTIRERFGAVKGLRVGVVGDIAHSRVCGSLVWGLTALGAQVVLVAPPTLLPACPKLLACPATPGEPETAPVTVSSRLDDVLPELDVVYMLRIQMERIEQAPFPSLREYAQLFGINRRRLAAMKPEAIIMHPGPVNRGVELTSDAVDTARNLLLYQVNAGVAVRMALMYLLLGGEDDGFAS